MHTQTDRMLCVGAAVQRPCARSVAAAEPEHPPHSLCAQDWDTPVRGADGGSLPWHVRRLARSGHVLLFGCSRSHSPGSEESVKVSVHSIKYFPLKWLGKTFLKVVSS